MKVTALIPDQIVSEVMELTKGKTITESLVIALRDWVKRQKLLELNQRVLKSPLELSASAEQLRKINRENDPS